MKKFLPILIVLAILAGCAGPNQRRVTRTTTTYPSQSYHGNPGYIVESQPVYAPPPASTAQQEQAKKIIKQGLVGAGVGAISAEASGGKAGTGALVGAGTTIIGSALVDALNQPPAAQPGYYYGPPDNQTYPPQNFSSDQSQRKVIRKYDSRGNIVSEEEVWD